jgi:hypothetical protein
MPKATKRTKADFENETLSRAAAANLHEEKMRLEYGTQVQQVLDEAGLSDKADTFWKLVSGYLLVGTMRGKLTREHASVYENAVKQFKHDTLAALEVLECSLASLPTHPHALFENLVETTKQAGMSAAHVGSVLRQSQKLLPELAQVLSTLKPLPRHGKNVDARLEKLRVIQGWFKALGKMNYRKGQPLQRCVRLFMTMTEGEPTDPTMKKIMQALQQIK